MRRTSVGFKVGIVLAVLHLGLAIYAFSAYINCKSSTAGLVFIIFFYLDAPFLLLPRNIFDIFGNIKPLIEFGIFGSMLWFFIPYTIDKIISLISVKVGTVVRIVIILAAIPLIAFGFKHLSYFGVRHSIRQQRPVELKKSLNKTSPDFLCEKIIFDSNESACICISNQAEKNEQVIVTSRNQAVFLDEKYKERSRIKFGDSGFSPIQPFADVNDSLRFLAYRYGKGIYIFDNNGNKLWNFTKKDKHGISIDGAKFGDVDADGKNEIAVFFRYTDGISLLDSGGNIKWTHPALSIGDLEMVDVDNDGKAEIIFSNSNNASGKTHFKFLNGKGELIKNLEVSTKSYEFAFIKWRDENYDILLTEENKIRIINLAGETIMSLNAPGCREYGNVNAAVVQLSYQQPRYLAVRKRLHPDILVLYVYDYEGKLVFQKTEVLKYGISNATIAVKTANEIDGEKLLTGSSHSDKGIILEYSLTK